MKQVCQRLKTKYEMLQESIDQYKAVFERAKLQFESVVSVSILSFSLRNKIHNFAQSVRERMKYDTRVLNVPNGSNSITPRNRADYTARTGRSAGTNQKSNVFSEQRTIIMIR